MSPNRGNIHLTHLMC